MKSPLSLMKQAVACLSFMLILQGQVWSQARNSAALERKRVLDNRMSPLSLTVRGGMTQFFGELNQQDMQTMGGMGLNAKINLLFSVSLDYTAGKVGGQKVEFFNSYFINEFNSTDLLIHWNLSEQLARFARDKESRINFGVYAGLGHMRFSAEAFDLTTNERVRFTNSEQSARNPLFVRWGTPPGEPSIKKTNERNIPLGVTLTFLASPTWQIGADYRFYFVRTDKLDATSGMRLINPEESTSYSDTPMDKFSFLSLRATYRFSRTNPQRGRRGSRRTYF
jgi:hypothetical protein